MSIADIKDNVNNLDKKTKEELVRYVHELLLFEKRQDSKMMSLRTEIKYLNRHLKKVRDLIDRTLKTNNKEEELWKE
jgi:hypothetical protein